MIKLCLGVETRKRSSNWAVSARTQTSSTAHRCGCTSWGSWSNLCWYKQTKPTFMHFLLKYLTPNWFLSIKPLIPATLCWSKGWIVTRKNWTFHCMLLFYLLFKGGRTQYNGTTEWLLRLLLLGYQQCSCQVSFSNNTYSTHNSNVFNYYPRYKSNYP